jgi:hypothetical protein
MASGLPASCKQRQFSLADRQGREFGDAYLNPIHRGEISVLSKHEGNRPRMFRQVLLDPVESAPTTYLL